MATFYLKDSHDIIKIIESLFFCIFRVAMGV